MIKFRGLAIADYKGTKNFKPRFVCGNLWRNEVGDYVIIGEFKDKDGLAKNYVVAPNSVRQFVCLDDDGNELYEGDQFTDKDGEVWTVKLAPQKERVVELDVKE